MNKQEFLSRLRQELSGLPQDDVEERLAFYTEMIDDLVEDGLSEEEAVAEIGPVEQLAPQIVADIPLPRLVKERIKPNRPYRAWEIVLLVLGFPLWFPLLLAAFAVVLSVYLTVWAVILSLWAVELSCVIGALGSAASGVLSIFRGEGAQGLLRISAALVLAGLSIFLFFGCVAATKGTLVLTKKIVLGVKSRLIRKENAA